MKPCQLVLLFIGSILFIACGNRPFSDFGEKGYDYVKIKYYRGFQFNADEVGKGVYPLTSEELADATSYHELFLDENEKIAFHNFFWYGDLVYTYRYGFKQSGGRFVERDAFNYFAPKVQFDPGNMDHIVEIYEAFKRISEYSNVVIEKYNLRENKIVIEFMNALYSICRSPESDQALKDLNSFYRAKSASESVDIDFDKSETVVKEDLGKCREFFQKVEDYTRVREYKVINGYE